MRTFVVTMLAASVALATFACDKPSGTTADGGKVVKRACKMQGKCYLCPDDAAMQKCIINPATSGCTLASDSDCEK